DDIVDPSSPMVAGIPNPITGNNASHASHTGLPAGAHVVIRSRAAGTPSTLYDYRPGGACSTATPTRTNTPIATPTCVPQSAGWGPGPDFPSPVVRAVGVWYPPNGRF